MIWVSGHRLPSSLSSHLKASSFKSSGLVLFNCKSTRLSCNARKKKVYRSLGHLRCESLLTLPRPATSAQGPVKGEKLPERSGLVPTIAGQEGADIVY